VQKQLARALCFSRRTVDALGLRARCGRSPLLATPPFDFRYVSSLKPPFLLLQTNATATHLRHCARLRRSLSLLARRPHLDPLTINLLSSHHLQEKPPEKAVFRPASGCG
jgi:hypothetical protein